MKGKYSSWFTVADELLSLHRFAYGQGGALHRFADSPLEPTAEAAAEWLRAKCEAGRWYWWDKTTLAMRAEEPLRSIERMIGDAAGIYDQEAKGRALIARLSAVRATIAAALNQ